MPDEQRSRHDQELDLAIDHQGISLRSMLAERARDDYIRAHAVYAFVRSVSTNDRHNVHESDITMAPRGGFEGSYY